MRKALLVLVWLVFVFLLLEAAGFAFYQLRISQPISDYGYPTGLTVAHPQLGFSYRPNFSGYFKGSAYQDIPIEINAQGFRDRDFAAQPGDGARIAVLGDSVVFGAGVRQEDRFTECLGDANQTGHAGRRVLNLGVNSYSFGHYLTLARLGFLGAAPDAVLVGITLNDFASMDNNGPARRARRHAEGWHKPDWVARIQERIGRTYAVRFLREIKTRVSYALVNVDEREEYHTKWMRTVVAGWRSEENRQRFETQLDDFAALLKGANIPFDVILFPELNELRTPSEFGEPRMLVRDLLDGRGLRYCDPYDDFARQSDLDALFLARDDIHYSAKGHQILCQSLSRCLDDLTSKP
ncbi:SGNH/GDSL hydrolase family protein [Thiocystis violacea]|uniref:SGNH/GDSL hydrolase family protein n=1 Tax=Thiocystis violacea TaxID=13725 RepID=UPI001904EB08|nr:SGNH/GDSL hydrolase family protein [Thiocystis violacea]